MSQSRTWGLPKREDKSSGYKNREIALIEYFPLLSNHWERERERERIKGFSKKKMSLNSI